MKLYTKAAPADVKLIIQIGSDLVVEMFGGIRNETAEV